MIGQFTYACFAATASSPGGWGVGKVRNLDDDEAKRLETQVAATLATNSPLPRFPTANDLDARPRRLRFRRSQPDRFYFWQTISAGLDASGRPGNAFTHFLAFDPPDIPAVQPSWIPIHVWRSDDWAVPFNADQVQSAPLMDEFPTNGDYADLDRTVDFLNADTKRGQAWALLLDAMQAAQDTQKAVAIVCSDADEAAGWVAALTSVITPEHARQRTFAIWEQASDLEALAVVYGLICLDRASLSPDTVTSDHVWVIDPLAPAVPEPLGEDGLAWRGAGADGLPIVWSQLANDVWSAGPATLRSCLDIVSRDESPAHGHLASFGKAILALDVMHEAHEEVQDLLEKLTRRGSAGHPRPAVRAIDEADEQITGLASEDQIKAPEDGSPQATDLLGLLQALDYAGFAQRAAYATAEDVASLAHTIQRTCDSLAREITEAQHGGASDWTLPAEKALVFANGCWRLPEASWRSDSHVQKLLDALAEVILSPEDSGLSAALNACDSTFIDIGVCERLNALLSSPALEPQRFMSREVAAWFFSWVGGPTGQLWADISSKRAASPLQQLLIRRQMNEGATGLGWYRLLLAPAPGAVAVYGGALPSLTRGEIDWLLSQAAASGTTEVADFWTQPNVMRAIDWPLGGDSPAWAGEALHTFGPLIGNADLTRRLELYSAVPADWWCGDGWQTHAHGLLLASHERPASIGAELLPEVAMAAILFSMNFAATAADLPGQGAGDVRSLAQGVALGFLPGVMLGARTAAQRLVGLLAFTHPYAQKWAAQIAAITPHGHSELGVGKIAPQLDPWLVLPLPPAGWRTAQTQGSVMDVLLASPAVAKARAESFSRVRPGMSVTPRTQPEFGAAPPGSAQPAARSGIHGLRRR